MIHPKRKDEYSVDTNNLTSVFLLAQSQGESNSLAPRHIIVRRRVPSRITNKPPCAPPPRTASETRPQPQLCPAPCTDDTRSSVYSLHCRPRRSHCTVRQQFALQLDIHVGVLRNAATHTVPSSQLQPSTQANVFLVLYGLRLMRVDCTSHRSSICCCE